MLLSVPPAASRSCCSSATAVSCCCCRSAYAACHCSMVLPLLAAASRSSSSSASALLARASASEACHTQHKLVVAVHWMQNYGPVQLQQRPITLSCTCSTCYVSKPPASAGCNVHGLLLQHVAGCYNPKSVCIRDVSSTYGVVVMYYNWGHSPVSGVPSSAGWGSSVGCYGIH